MIQSSHNVILSLTGKSCSGKSYLLSELLRTGNFSKLVTSTTRSARAGEIDGEDYHFISKELANSLIFGNEFFEYTTFNEHVYGITVEEIEKKLKQPQIPVVILTPEGASAYRTVLKSRNVKLCSVFLDVPEEVLFSRLVMRTEFDILNIEAGQSIRPKISAGFDRVKTLSTVERNWKQLNNWDKVLTFSNEAIAEKWAEDLQKMFTFS